VLGATCRRPSTASSRWASMNATTCATGGRAPSQETRDPLQDLIGPPQLPHLLIELPHPGRLGVVVPG
jgi:hypothetical protein